MTDRGPGDWDTDPAAFQEFRNEARARSADLVRLSSSETEAIERVGRLFRQLRHSHGLSLPDVSARADVPVVYLALMEHGLLRPEELQPGFLARVGTALESDVDALLPGPGGVFASIALTLLSGGLRSDSRLGPDGGGDTVTGLISTIESAKEGVTARVQAVLELGEYTRDQRARGALVRALSADADPLVRMAALECLGAVADVQEVRSALLALLSGPDEALRARAAEIVARGVSEDQPEPE